MSTCTTPKPVRKSGHLRPNSQAGPKTAAQSGGNLDPRLLIGEYFRFFLKALAFWGRESKSILEKLGTILG